MADDKSLKHARPAQLLKRPASKRWNDQVCELFRILFFFFSDHFRGHSSHGAGELVEMVDQKKEGRQPLLKTLLKTTAGGPCPWIGEEYFRILHGEDQRVPRGRQVRVFRNFFEDSYAHRFRVPSSEEETHGVSKNAGFWLEARAQRVSFPRRAGGAREIH